MISNGRYTKAQLRIVQRAGGRRIRLEPRTAAAYRSLRDHCAKHGRTISIAAPAGGYRSITTQTRMRRYPWLYGLSRASSVTLAAPGYSSHGHGDRIDIVGTPMDRWFLDAARRFGFRREFGAADPNHFRFTTPTNVK